MRKCSVIVKVGKNESVGMVSDGPIDLPPTDSMLLLVDDTLPVVIKGILRFLKDHEKLPVRSCLIEFPAELDRRQATRLLGACGRITEAIAKRNHHARAG